MADLDLKELRKLVEEGWAERLETRGAYEAGQTVLPQLRPLLDLADSMGEALRKCGRHTVLCPYPRANGPCDCGFGVLVDYQRAKGEA